MERGNYVPGIGPLNAKLAVIGEAPGEKEDLMKIPFVGPSGEILDDICKESGFSRDEVYLTNVVKYRPPNNKFDRLHEIGVDLNEQIRKLWDEIGRVRPNCILAVGDKALHAITGRSGIKKLRGSILQSRNFNIKVVPTIHPANLITRTEFDENNPEVRKPWPWVWKSVMVMDFKRAYEESKYAAFNLPDRHLRVARHGLDVSQFFSRNKGRRKVAVDIESINCFPVCVGFAFDRHEALSIPLFNRIRTTVPKPKGRKKQIITSRPYNELKLAAFTRSDQIYTWQQIDRALNEYQIIGQNFKYDEDKLAMLGFRLRNPLFADTMLLAHTINPEMPNKGQAFLTSAFTREPYYKDEGYEFVPGRDDIDRLFLYNAKDCAVDFEIWEEEDSELDFLSDKYSIPLREFFYNYVMRLHPLYLRMENRGIRIDKSAREYLGYKYEKWHEDIQRRFIAYVGHPVNVNSNPAVAHLLYNELNIPRRKGASEDVIAGLLANVVKDERRTQILSDIVEDRKVRRGKTVYIDAKPDYDGRMRTSAKICGTETARSSTNILKSPVRPEKMGIPFQIITKHGDMNDVGVYLIADEGHVFVKIDLSQAEPRIISVLSKDWKLYDVFQEGKIDIHRRTAGLIFDYIDSFELDNIVCSVPHVDAIGKDSPERFMGKKVRNGASFDMGKRELSKNVTSDAKKFHIDAAMSEWRAGKCLEKFHAAAPNIKEVFHAEVQESLNNTRTLINPFGRVRHFYERWGNQLFKEAYAHIPQSTVHDTLTMGWVELEYERMTDCKVYMEAHDSLTFQMKFDEVEDRCKVIKSCFEREIDFNPYCSLKRDKRLVIPVDFEIAENLKEYSKYKVGDRFDIHEWREKQRAA